MNVFRVDRGKLGAARIDHNGNLVAGAAITRTGVFTYQHRDKDGKTFTTHELRHPDDVFNVDSVASFMQLPITDEHPAEGHISPDNVQKLSVGNLGDTIARDGKFVMADMIIRHAPTIAKVRGDDQPAKRELSCGYQAEVVEEDGIYDGERYDHRQTKIRGNHVALVRSGRAGPEVRMMLDSMSAPLLEDDEQEWPNGFGEAHEDKDGENIIGHTSSGKPVHANHKHPAHNKLNAQEHREASNINRELLTGGTPNTTNRSRLAAMDHHKDEHARARRGGDRSGNAIGKTSSGREIFDEHNHPDHATFTAIEHNESARMHKAKFHQAQADRSTAEAAPPSPTNDKKFVEADDKMRLHDRAQQHHEQEEHRLHHYHLDWNHEQETDTDSNVVLMRPR